MCVCVCMYANYKIYCKILNDFFLKNIYLCIMFSSGIITFYKNEIKKYILILSHSLIYSAAKIIQISHLYEVKSLMLIIIYMQYK